MTCAVGHPSARVGYISWTVRMLALLSTDLRWSSVSALARMTRAPTATQFGAFFFPASHRAASAVVEIAGALKTLMSSAKRKRYTFLRR